ncbi:MAG: Mut7-C RNAse domain-containing protein, partial [Acidobacteriota bacterium]
MTPRFLADVMLGSLAKWLRILGYDTVYNNRIQDDEIIARSLAEQR